MTHAAEAEFSKALFDRRSAPPSSLRGSDASQDRRFAVYRNNVAVALAGALETRFPATRRIVGPDFFAGLARGFVRAAPPRSPLMMIYGDAFPDFIDGAAGLEDAPYLSDVARLEAARTRAYHATDAEPLGAGAFAGINPGALEDVTVLLHPSVEIVRSAYPVAAIWAMNRAGEEPVPITEWSAEDALVSRPHMDVEVRALPAGGATFLQTLAHGGALGEAARKAAAETPDFDLTQNLVALIEHGLAVRLGVADATSGADQ